MINQLLKLQQNIYEYHNNENSYNPAYDPYLYFFPIGDYFSIYYHGAGYDDDPFIKAADFEEDYNFGFCALLDFLTEQENAEKVISLVFDGPDEGANGVNEWCFDRITSSTVTFPNLKEFKVKLTNAGDHNISSINYLDEAGTIAQLVAKMPTLEILAVPAAPNLSFFELVHNNLQSLTIQTDTDGTNSFLENMTQSNNFPKLYSLDYAEPSDPFNDLTVEDYTPLETYKKLFKSNTFSNSHFHFTLRNSRLTLEQLFEIQKENLAVQFLYINSQAGKYVNHLIQEKNK